MDDWGYRMTIYGLNNLGCDGPLGGGVHLVRPNKKVMQSMHPYVGGLDTLEPVTVPEAGAVGFIVTFEDTCSLETDSDYIK